MIDPFDQFALWFAEAEASEPNDPNAFALATATPDGRPSVRIVLMKFWDARGFVFYSNMDSRKGSELAANPHVHMDFHWKSRRRQVRIDGLAATVPDDEADAYFASRPRDSQIGAWASAQSRPLPDRATFDARFADVAAEFAGRDVPRPPRWTGWRVTPHAIEFWQDRDNRLHERTLFTRRPDGWTQGLLYP
jgi:pyridoxamine 5'-phosphate oxidase